MKVLVLLCFVGLICNTGARYYLSDDSGLDLDDLDLDDEAETFNLEGDTTENNDDDASDVIGLDVPEQDDDVQFDDDDLDKRTSEPLYKVGAYQICKSYGGHRNCDNYKVKEIRYIKLHYKYGKSGRCVKGKTYGFKRNAMWVNGGCKGVFILRGYSPNAPKPTSRCRYQTRLSTHTGTCGSLTGRRPKKCFEDSSRKYVSIGSTHKSKWCIKGVGYGISNHHMWTQPGCKGIFTLRYRQKVCINRHG